ncbi:MAG TPA: N-6 DNA methylase [Phycisphaerae bacterium]|nr:N-6 DNA methylase [Phycisphaerae bacterium]HOB73315.1 N-6 DNA methylase [Phycisphaerae bacterium]HOJ55703.1 N-6 DNA methylase [Phycisphaerae bacterium]HOL26134.1 N-6 DNA methylase [Phycisphaerae bacterium]HPP22050.1 N-6 DNA methylase [Phycisphaerae bacterium]
MTASLFEEIRGAIEVLGCGFLAPRGNRALRRKLADGSLTEKRFCEQVTIFAYRLAFLLAAEKSGWLKRVLDAGLSGCGTPDLADCELGGEALVETIRRLAPFEQSTIEWAGKLGAAHEAILELRPTLNVAGRQFKLLAAEGSHRKSTGSYYTPSRFIDCLLDSALEPVVAEALKRAGDGGKGTSAAKTRPRLERTLLGLRVCDPSCGAGYFLAAAAWRLARHLAVIRCGSADPPPGSLAAALRDVIGQCVYGVDLSPVATELCKLRLQMELLSAGARPVGLDGRIVCGNALTGEAAGGQETSAQGSLIPPSGFDVVIGNPPYRAVRSDEERRTVRRRYPLAAPTSNSAADFIELCWRIVRPGGRVGLVVPKSLTYSYSWRGLRAALAPAIVSAVDVGLGWDDVLLEQILLTYGSQERATGRSTAPRGRRAIEVGVLRNGGVCRRRVDAGLVERLGILPTGLNEDDLKLLECMLRRAEGTLDQICTTRRGSGLQRWLGPRGDIGVIAGKDIREFGPLRPGAFVRSSQVDPARLRWVEPPQAIFQNIIAHVTRPVDHIRLIGTIARERVACLDTVNLLTLHDRSVSPETLCALLMSDLMGWFVYACVYNKAVRTMHFDGYFLAKIPLPRSGSLSALAPAAANLAGAPYRPENWRAVNEAVFDLYGIPSRLRPCVPLCAPCRC